MIWQSIDLPSSISDTGTDTSFAQLLPSLAEIFDNNAIVIALPDGTLANLSEKVNFAQLQQYDLSKHPLQIGFKDKKNAFVPKLTWNTTIE